MLHNHSSKHTVDPWSTADVQFWTRHWDISQEQLRDAILETGSLEKQDIHKYLQQHGAIYPLKKYITKIKRIHLFGLRKDPPVNISMTDWHQGITSEHV